MDRTTPDSFRSPKGSNVTISMYNPRPAWTNILHIGGFIGPMHRRRASTIRRRRRRKETVTLHRIRIKKAFENRATILGTREGDAGDKALSLALATHRRGSRNHRVHRP